MTFRTACRVSLWLGAASVLAILAASMALQDIYHGEPDLTLEWSVVRVSFLIIVAFHAAGLAAAWKGVAGSGPGDASRATDAAGEVLGK
jgi:hypothetical protein